MVIFGTFGTVVTFGTPGTPVAFATLKIGSVFNTPGIIPVSFGTFFTLLYIFHCTSYSSIHSRDITISGLKKTSVILEIFFRLLLHSNPRVVPYQATKFRPNRATCCGVMTSYTIWRWRQGWLNTTSGFVFNDVTLFRRSISICKLNFVDIS